MTTKARAPSSAHATTAKNGSSRAAATRPTFEEVFVRNDVVSLCLLLNRRARTMRVIDFRAGASPAKRAFVQSIAQRERIDKVVVLVERDECATWARLGFVREGTIPGFYKRSDAHIMGQVVPALDAPTPTPRARPESGVFTVGHLFSPTEADDDALDEAPTTAGQAQADKSIAAARKLAKELGALPSVKLAAATEAEVHKRVAAATKEGRALTGFESFGRDVTRSDVVATARGGGELVVGAEVQRCYGNAFVEPLTGPRDDKERNLLAAALIAACERLQADEIGCAFALSPIEDVRMATAFVAAGFRRTGVLRQHLIVGRARVDAILWSRKSAVADEDA